MRKLHLGLLSNGLVALFVAGGLLLQTAPASTIEIEFTGLDIVYDTPAIFEIGDPDPLTTVTFSVDGTPAGPTLLDDIFADVEISPVVNIPVGGGTVTTGPLGGQFDLLIPGIGLSLDLDDVSVTYTVINIPNIPDSLQFIFAGSLADIAGQALPYDLVIGDPVTVSFSTQVNPGTLTHDATDTYVTSFTASGTGEIRGQWVPEPTSLLLLLPGLVGLLATRRR